MARYGRLECGKNVKGTLSEICDQCKSVDDEDHRINYCIRWKAMDMYDNPNKIVYTDVYTNDMTKIRKLTACIERIWNTRTAQGTMNIQQ